MKILLVGATGTIGRAIRDALVGRHDVVEASRGGGARVDISDPASVRALFASVGAVDAVVSASGAAAWKPLDQLTDEDFAFSLANKLMGQVNLVRYGTAHVREGGSFTLTSGVLAREPAPGSAAVTLVNAALEGFARAAALELPRGQRVNVVSPPWVSETLQKMGRDPAGGLPAATVARAYVEAVEGRRTGEILDARTFA
jgi:NAD(P)-dependent dehydrogenase (short-subunit alcohol dehydrogenase family)